MKYRSKIWVVLLLAGGIGVTKKSFGQDCSGLACERIKSSLEKYSEKEFSKDTELNRVRIEFHHDLSMLDELIAKQNLGHERDRLIDERNAIALRAYYTFQVSTQLIDAQYRLLGIERGYAVHYSPRLVENEWPLGPYRTLNPRRDSGGEKARNFLDRYTVVPCSYNGRNDRCGLGPTVATTLDSIWLEAISIGSPDASGNYSKNVGCGKYGEKAKQKYLDENKRMILNATAFIQSLRESYPKTARVAQDLFNQLKGPLEKVKAYYDSSCPEITH